MKRGNAAIRLSWATRTNSPRCPTPPESGLTASRFGGWRSVVSWTRLRPAISIKREVGRIGNTDLEFSTSTAIGLRPLPFPLIKMDRLCSKDVTGSSHRVNNNEEYLAKIAPDIGKAAGVLARQFPSLEYDDIYQELWVYVLERKKELKTHEENGRPVDFLVKAGQRICGKEIAAATPRNDEYWYTPNVVRKMLDTGMLYFSDAGEPAGRSDLTEAFRALDDEGK